MDIGLLLQATAGESMVPDGNSVTNNPMLNGRWPCRSGVATENANASFLQIVRQLLGSIDKIGEGEATCGVDSLTNDSKDGAASSTVSMEKVVCASRDDMDQEGISDTYLVDEGNGSLLLTLLSEQWDALDPALAQALQEDTQAQRGLLALLTQDQPSALETPTAESPTAINIESQTGSQVTRPVLRSMMEGSPNQEQQQQTSPASRNHLPIHAESGGDQAIQDDIIFDDKRVERTINQVLPVRSTTDNPDAWMVEEKANKADNGVGLTEKVPAEKVAVEAEATEKATMKKGMALDTVKTRTVTVSLVDWQNRPLRQETGGSTSDWVKTDKPPVHVAAQGDATDSQALADSASSAQQADKMANLEWAGLKKDRAKGTAVPNESAQVASSTLDQDEAVSTNIRGVASGDSLSDKPSTSASANPSPSPASDDTAFQKTVMDQIVEKAAIRSINDRSEMRIQLKPERLGDVRMRIVSEKNELIVEVVTDRQETKEIIENQIHHLKAELDKQGLSVGKIEVMLNSANDQQDSRETFFQMFKQSTSDSGRRRGDRQQPKATPSHASDEEAETDPSEDGISYFA